MKENPFRQDNEEMKDLLIKYTNLREGRNFSFIEEEAFERIIDYYDEKEDLSSALEAVDYGIQQYPFSALVQIKKADLLIATRHYSEALGLLEKAELLDRTDINVYIFTNIINFKIIH